jgi:phosphoribosylaminoimidazole (AIR) synthetase
MDRVFNMGIGMIAVVQSGSAPALIDAARRAGVEAWAIGSIEPGEGVTYA